MKRNWQIAGCVAALLGGPAVASAQSVPQPPVVPAPVIPAQPDAPAVETAAATAPPAAPRGYEAESRQAEVEEDLRQGPSVPRPGPKPVADVGSLSALLGTQPSNPDSPIRTFGWLEGGHTFSSTGSGPMAVQPRLNRFGDQFLLRQIGLVVQKPLAQDRWDWGFNVRYFAGADAATGQPRGGIDDPPDNARFSHDFRDLYLSAHLPILTDGGVNVKVGRMNTVIGYNGFLSPYRPLTSNDYQFFYSQDGAFTGFLTQLVVNDQLDIWNGMTLGANTFFAKRSEDSYCYIGQVNYWLTTEKRTRLTGSVYAGPDAIFAAPGLNGDFVTMVEARVQQNWSESFTQVVQSNFGWDTNTPVGTGSWYGVFSQQVLHVNTQVDLISRGEWFRDIRGTRTGVATDYSSAVVGMNWHPNDWFEFRPEVRGDFAGKPAFGVPGRPREYSQLTGALSFLVKF